MENVRTVRIPQLALVTGLAVLLGSSLLMTLSANAQEATPESANDSLPPILWELTEFVDSVNGSMVVENPEKYTVQFLPDGLLAVGADCNRAALGYTQTGPSLEIKQGAMTLAACPEGSRSNEFVQQLGFVTSFTYDQSEATDQLVLAMMADGGFLRFQPSLTGVVWQWEEFQGGDGAIVAPDDPTKYTLQFEADGTVTGQVACNRGMGTYTVDGSSISIVLATTKMACPPGSLDNEFGRYISESNSFVIRNGQFSLALPMDSGIASFNPVVDMPDSEATPESGS